jgi:hypothetical protein
VFKHNPFNQIFAENLKVVGLPDVGSVVARGHRGRCIIDAAIGTHEVRVLEALFGFISDTNDNRVGFW